MAPKKWRLGLAVVLFVGWVGFLTYLAFANRNSVVLSRPQLLVSNVHIIAKLDGADAPDEKVVVEEVLYAADADAVKKGDTVEVGGLKQVAAKHGWNGPGSYLLPLMRTKDGKFSLTITPSSPGYPPAKFSTADRRTIYEATDETRRNLKQIYDDWGR